ncbi:Disease resistance protein CHL1 [Cardamine amara subsp. amara]|uniref:Disease resistance protein CHL1 n=1 Tax=Cardamine amara subsp. amara TaxID=228776 RepID=A0ABD0ZFM0_CARAN
MITSSLSSSDQKVEVFLNFRGEVRRGFLSHLSHALVRLNIRCFMNEEEEEEKGRTVKQFPSDQVLRAILEAEVAVIVLSKNYASSSRCLDELRKITETKSITMVPVYYEVDISDVRDQRGSFGEDFQRLGQEESPETMESWREALTKLTDSKPYFSPQLSKDDDSKLTREITRHVSGLLSRSRLHKDLLPGKACGDKSTTRKTSLSRLVSHSDKLIATQSGISYSPITMDHQIELISEALKLESTSEVRVVGISGVAGIGKTTIARHLYQNLSLTFQDHCFFETAGDILNQCPGTQGIGKPRGTKYISQSSRNFHDQGCDLPASYCSQDELTSPKNLKRKATETLCSDLGSDDKKRTRFWQQRVLVVVDNVENKTQLEEIMKDVNRLGPGSRVIIVTTQDKSLLSKFGVEHVYEVDSLKYDEALELFSACAFKQQYPPETFEQLSVRAVKLTGCLPLGLKLLGSFLCGRTKEDWECKLKRLGAGQDKAIAQLSELSSQGIPQDQN